MGIELLGPLTIDGSPRRLTRRDRVVLATLAVRHGQAVSPGVLADALWGESPPTSWQKVVQGCVVRLRKVLGADAIATLPQGYRLSMPPDEVDIHHFDRLVLRARELLVLGEPERARFLVGEALALWRGEPLPDILEWDDGRIEAGRLGEERLDAEELSLDASLRLGECQAVLADAHRMVKLRPLRERRWALLALAQYQAGRQADALRTLRDAKTVLSTQLGLDPGPDLAALEQAILKQDPSLLVGPAMPAPSATCPWQGLRPYQIADSETFFGREADVAACLERLAREGTLAIVGPSGCGKSSLARAGVASALQRQGARVVVVTPGRHPMDVLTNLPTSGTRPVLVVDQCEEVFSLCDDPAERGEFLDALCRYALTAPLVLCLRADRIGDLSVHAGASRLVERGLYLLAAMRAEALRAAIEGPARQAVLRLEPGLVDLLVREVEGEPGALPLLSHALQVAWVNREGRTLTVDGYRRSGGIRGAVAQSAESVYEGVAPAERVLLRDLVLRMVTAGPEGEPVRSRVPRRLISDDPEHARLIQLLVDARLVTSDADVLELAHESLARAWPRLRSWLEEDTEGQRILRHLTMAADAWEAMGQPESELYRGARLQQALEWRQRAQPDLTPTEAEFLRVGQAREEERERSAEQRAAHERRVNRRLRGLLVGLAVLTVVVVLAGTLAVRQARVASDTATVADAGRVGAQAVLTKQPDRAILLAVAALRLDDSRSTRGALLQVLTRTPQLVGAVRGRDGGFFGAAVSPDGRTVAVYDDENVVWLYDAATLQVRAKVDVNLPGTHRDALYPTAPLSFSPDGKTLAVGTSTLDPVPVKLLDTQGYDLAAVQLGRLPRVPSHVIDVEYSADGTVLAATFDHYGSAGEGVVGSSVAAWDTDDPARPIAKIDHVQAFAGLALSPDGDELFVDRLERGEHVIGRYRLHGPGPTHTSLAYPGEGVQEVSADGRLLSTTDGNDVLLLDTATGRVVRRLAGHQDAVSGVAFSQDGESLAAASFDRTVIVWDVATGSVQEQLDIESRNLWGLAFSPDGSRLYTAGVERDLKVWDIAGKRRFIPRIAASNPYPGAEDGWVRTSPTGQKVSYYWQSDRGAMIDFLDLGSGRATRAVDTGHGEYGDLAWSPGGDRVVTVGADGIVRMWDPETGRLVRRRKVSATHIAGVAFLSEERLVAGNRAGEVFMLDARTLRRTGLSARIPGSTHRVHSLYAGVGTHTVFVITGEPVPDEPYLTWSPEHTWALVDTRSGKVRKGSLPIDQAATADVSSDGRRVAVGGGDGEVVILDTASGRLVRPPVAGHDSLVDSVEYAPGPEKTLLTGAQDGSIGLWDGRAGRLVGTLTADPSAPSTVRLLPDGNTVVIAAHNGRVYEWNLRKQSWIDAACRIAGRDLTPAEWREAFGSRPYTPACPR